jgi:protein gp37
MTKIEWSDQTWNPVTGCDKVSQGCKNCYAEVMHRRLRGMFPAKYSMPFLSHVQIHPEELKRPLQWKKPSRVFVNSMSDLFHDFVPYSFIYQLFAVMDVCHWHTFQILTKRPQRMLEFMKYYPKILPNVWLGVSCEDQKTADERIPILLQTSAAFRFVSCEPLLGKIDLNKSTILYADERFKNDNKFLRDFQRGLLTFNKQDPYHKQFVGPDWIIAGGESGRNARPMHPDWLRSIRDQCEANNIPFFFKQWGEFMPLEFDVQPPFRFFSSNGKLIDAHGIDVIDPETGDPGRYKGMRFMDAMDAIHFCMEEGVDQVDFLHRGKEKFPSMIDGKQHLEFPQSTQLITTNL